MRRDETRRVLDENEDLGDNPRIFLRKEKLAGKYFQVYWCLGFRMKFVAFSSMCYSFTVLWYFLGKIGSLNRGSEKYEPHLLYSAQYI